MHSSVCPLCIPPMFIENIDLTTRDNLLEKWPHEIEMKCDVCISVKSW